MPGAPASYIYRRVAGGILLRVLSVERVPGTGRVYDLEVEGEHNYLTSSFVVHNSAAGSLVVYSLGITGLDPLTHGLIFERFLNPSRITMPDIDLDFQDDRRDEVIRYVTAKYGDDRVAQIITFGTLAAKAAVRDVGRALGMGLNDVDRVARLVPTGPHVTLEQALKQPDLQALYTADPSVRELIDTARKLEGVARHASTHAAGVVISRDPLVQHVPVQRSSRAGQG
jgi:DNA polymerase-3 subunit alpha